MVSVLQKTQTISPPAAGFEHINRFMDRRSGRIVAKLLPGEFYVTRQDELIGTVLGSCISACIRDRSFRVGGMNHFMLPDSQRAGSGAWDDAGVSAATRYGAAAMEYLINALLKLGAHRRNLEVKLVGGGRVLSALSDIGRRNIAFVRHYLHREGLEITGEDVGDVFPRKVYYDPKSGKVRVRRLRNLHNDTIERRESAYKHEIEAHMPAGEVELF